MGGRNIYEIGWPLSVWSFVHKSRLVLATWTTFASLGATYDITAMVTRLYRIRLEYAKLASPDLRVARAVCPCHVDVQSS